MVKPPSTAFLDVLVGVFGGAGRKSGPKKRLKNRRAIPIIQRWFHAMTPPAVPLPRVESPCINVCTLDAQKVCIGCGRTIEEIAVWSRLGDEERRAVCEQARRRNQSRKQSISSSEV
jgi:uncharacterized protein